jgi:predicted metalloprotease with PDZ domain
MNHQRTRIIPTLFLLGMLVSSSANAQHFEHKERHLGPTGLFGVTSPEDITITTVVPGSPADGKLKVGDVIVAAGGVPFKESTRKQLADAIDQAETEEAKGLLTMTLKDGTKADLQLKVLGTYSATAPYECPKSNAIITQAAEAICKSKEFSAHGLPIDLLGLLATGEPK